jgi:SP family facilitated glucose transporter-like MFS transporter 8
LKISIDQGNSRSPTGSWQTLLNPSVLKPTAIVLVLMLCQQLSGINAVQSYTVEIFQSAGPHVDPNVATIVIGIVQVVFVLVSMLIVSRNRIGRRVLLIAADVVMAVGLASVGIFFYLKDSWTEDKAQSMAWLPLVSLTSYVIAYSVAVGPLPWLLVSELIPPHARGILPYAIQCLRTYLFTEEHNIKIRSKYTSMLNKVQAG